MPESRQNNFTGVGGGNSSFFSEEREVIGAGGDRIITLGGNNHTHID